MTFWPMRMLFCSSATVSESYYNVEVKMRFFFFMIDLFYKKKKQAECLDTWNHFIEECHWYIYINVLYFFLSASKLKWFLIHFSVSFFF